MMNQDLPIDLKTLNELVATDHDRLAAATLLAELRTRVATRVTHSRSGGEEMAVSSLSRIVPLIRSILKRYPEAQRFQMVALSVSDDLIRSHIHRWSDWHQKERFRSDDVCRIFRQELGTLQPALRRVCLLMDKIRNKEEVQQDDLFMGVTVAGNQAPPIRSRRAMATIEPEIQGRFPQCEEVLAAEKEEILKGKESQKLTDVAGLALSGGGIRSATFALGVVKVLVERGIFKQFHYLSTVSGGGYLGTFLSSYLNDPDRRIDEVFNREAKTDSAPVRHLRNNSKFLLEGGVKNQMRSLLVMVFGIVTNLLILVPLIAVLALLTSAAGKLGFWGDWVWWNTAGNHLWQYLGSPVCSVFFVLLLGSLLLQLLGRPLVARWSRGPAFAARRKKIRRRWELLGNGMTIVMVVVGVIALIPFVFRVFNGLLASGGSGLQLPGWLAAIAGPLVPLVSGPLAAKFQERQWLGPLLRVVFFISGPLFLLCLYLSLGIFFLNLETFPVWTAVGGFVVVGIIYWTMDLNALSPHHLYRQQLAGCYLVRKNPANDDPKRRGSLRLSRLGKGTDAPYHLINAAVNLPASREKELRGRKGDFFLFSKKFCGSPLTGYAETREVFERADPNFDLGSAMAVSGAAFSSNMGAKRLEHLRFLLTILNVRLGYWIPNCLSERNEGSRKLLNGKRTPGVVSLFKELFGQMTEKDEYHNLSDGGHIENLGVYELMRRKAKFIVAVDGECDPDMYFEGLVKLIRYARIDLGAEVELDPADLAKGEDGLSPTHFLLGRIVYSDQSVGWLLYLKLSLTGDEAPDLLDYQREHPEFPHQTTVDQIYSERQFESYRWLGQHVAEELFRSEYLESKSGFFAARSGGGTTNLSDWFEVLAMNLLPDNHEVFRPDSSNLEGIKIGVSISGAGGISDEQVGEATREVCRMLIASGASVVFGHDWRPGGVMTEIAEFARNDRLIHERDDQPVLFNFYRRDFGIEQVEPDLGEFEGFIDRKAVKGDVHDLRKEIDSLADARICLGGKTKKEVVKDDGGFTGDIPGILEEAYRAIKDGQPVLISGCLGGASEWMAARLRGEKPEEAPDYALSEDGGELAGFPATAEDLVEEIRKEIIDSETLPEEIKDLHRRLWQTTQLEAAIAVMEQVLGLEKLRRDGAL